MTFEAKEKHAQQVVIMLGAPPLYSLGVSRHIYIHPTAQAAAAAAAHCSEANPALPARSWRKKEKKEGGEKKNLCSSIEGSAWCLVPLAATTLIRPATKPACGDNVPLLESFVSINRSVILQ